MYNGARSSVFLATFCWLCDFEKREREKRGQSSDRVSYFFLFARARAHLFVLERTPTRSLRLGATVRALRSSKSVEMQPRELEANL